MDSARRFLLSLPERIEELRMRLCDLSWFMKYHNEHISRAANAEDGTKEDSGNRATNAIRCSMTAPSSPAWCTSI